MGWGEASWDSDGYCVWGLAQEPNCTPDGPIRLLQRSDALLQVLTSHFTGSH